MNIGVEFEGFAVTVEFDEDDYPERPSDEEIIKAAREEMIDQIKDAPDGFFTIEDAEDE